MMRCREIEKQLLRFQDGFLSEEERAGLERHLKSCPSCARRQREYKTLQRLLGSGQAGEPLPFFWERLRIRIGRESGSSLLRLWQRWCWRSVPVFLGAALVIGIVLYLLVGLAPDQMTPSELLLLNDQASVAEWQLLMEEGKMEDKQMRLIFSAGDETESIERN